METEEGMDIKMNGNSPIALNREFLRECGGRLAREISLDPILKGFESCKKELRFILELIKKKKSHKRAFRGIIPC